MSRRRDALAPAVAGAVIATLTVTGCADRSVAPLGIGGALFRPEAGEQALRAKARKEEQALARRTTTFDDRLLEAYLVRIGARVGGEEIPAAGGADLRLVVLLDPTLNVFAMPDGHVYVHTGLLSHLENEAQLAAILAHELAHVTRRHALRAAVTPPKLTGGSLAGGVRSPTADAILGLGLTLAATAAVQGYGGALEIEADREGLDRLVAAGYDPREAPRAFYVLLRESGEGGPVESFFFGTPARLQERLETTGRLVTTTHASAAEPGRIVTSEDFELRMRPVVRENAIQDIKLGRFARAQRQLDRLLRETPTDPLAHLYYGELHRLRAQRAPSADEEAGLARLALERYERAAALDPSLPDPHRQLGLLHYQQKDAARAKAAFERYLELNPDAPDARRIKEYLVELGR